MKCFSWSLRGITKSRTLRVSASEKGPAPWKVSEQGWSDDPTVAHWKSKLRLGSVPTHGEPSFGDLRARKGSHAVMVHGLGLHPTRSAGYSIERRSRVDYPISPAECPHPSIE